MDNKKKKRPHLWATGPDEKVRAIRYKFLRAIAQARYWCQDWLIDWPDYLELMQGKRHGRGLKNVNLCRKDTSGPWSLDNVIFMTRKKMMIRNKQIMADGTYHKRTRRKTLD